MSSRSVADGRATPIRRGHEGQRRGESRRDHRDPCQARRAAHGLRARDSHEYSYPYNVDWEGKAAAEWRRRWRANVLLLKAKLEFIDSGDTTLERELLPYRLLAGGQTVEDLIVAGGLPMLTTGSGS